MYRLSAGETMVSWRNTVPRTMATIGRKYTAPPPRVGPTLPTNDVTMTKATPVLRMPSTATATTGPLLHAESPRSAIAKGAVATAATPAPSISPRGSRTSAGGERPG